jgi:ComEC/Rec2-related protein
MGSVYLIATILACWLEEYAKIFGFLLPPLMFLILWLSRDYKKEIKVVFGTAVVAINLFNFYSLQNIQPAKELVGKTAKIDGEVLDFAFGETKPAYVIAAKISSESGPPLTVKALLLLNKEMRLECFDRVSCEVKFTKIKKSVGFDSARHYKTKGITLSARPVGQVNVKAQGTWKRHISAIGQYLKRNVEGTFIGYQGDVMKAFVLGDKSALSQDCKDAFKRSGIYHILAVSGLHISILTQLISLLVAKVGLGRRCGACFSIVGSLLFGAVVGFSPSVLRSVTMTIVYFLGQLVAREPDSLNSLGLAAIILLVKNPYAVFDVGFELSFLATWGIIVLAPFVNKRLQNLPFSSTFRGWISVSVGANLATLPILVSRFGEISLVSPLTNLFLACLLPFCFASVLIFAVIKPLLVNVVALRLLSLIVGGLVTIVVDVARIFAAFPTCKVQMWQIVLCCVWVVVFLLLRFEKVRELTIIQENRWVRLVVHGVFLLVLIVGSAVSFALRQKEAKIFVLPGNGNVLINADGKNLLFGANRTKAFFNQLNWVLSQLDNDHIDIFFCKKDKNSADILMRVCEDYDIERVLLQDTLQVEFEYAAEKHPTIQLCSGLDQIRLGEQAVFKSAGDVATFVYKDSCSVFLEPSADVTGLDDVLNGADNIIVSRKVKLPTGILRDQRIVVYDLKLANVNNLSTATYEVYTTQAEKVLTIRLNDNRVTME